VSRENVGFAVLAFALDQADGNDGQHEDYENSNVHGGFVKVSLTFGFLLEVLRGRAARRPT